jgi:DNA primase small subunit
LTSLKNDFVTLCLRDQDCFKTERQWETLLSLLPGDRGRPLLSSWNNILMIETIGNLRAKWQVEELDSEEKWTDVMKAIGSLMKSDKLLGVSSPHKVCEAS